MRSPLRSPAQVEGTQGFLPQPGKDLERPSSTRLEARFPYRGSGAMTRSPCASRPFPPPPNPVRIWGRSPQGGGGQGAPRPRLQVYLADRSEEHTSELQSP